MMTKYILSVNFFLCIVLVLFLQNASGQNLLAHYEFNNNANDLSVNRNHGLIKGNVTAVADRFGNPCSAYMFDGKSGFIEVPSSPSLESPRTKIAFTVWYKLTNTFSPVNWLTILCKGTSVTETLSSPQYRLQVYQSSEVKLSTCSPFYPTPSSTISVNTEFTACDNFVTSHFMQTESWHFYALTYDGTYLKSYMDGRKVFESQYSGSFNFNPESLLIGKDNPGNTEYFNGAMDDLRIYDAPLSDIQIDNIYRVRKPSITIADDLVVQPQYDLNLEAEPGSCYTYVNFPLPVVTKNCLPYKVTQMEGKPSGSAFPTGKSKITFKISPTSGTIKYSTFYINVFDKEPPVIKTENDTVVTVNAGDSAIVFDYPMATATDNCGIKYVKQISGKTSGSFFDAGIHVFSFQSEDSSGNISYGSFKLTVLKNPLTPVKDITISPVPALTDTLTVFNDTLSSDLYKKLNIVLLIDISSSMGEGKKFDLLKESLISLISTLRYNDQITLMTFSDKPNVIFNTSDLLAKKEMINKIRNLKVSGGTNIDLGLTFAYDLMDKIHLSDGSNQVYLFTDGSFSLSSRQKKDIRSSSNNTSKLIRLGIFNILNEGRNMITELKELAEQTGGNYLMVRTIEESRNTTINHLKATSLK